MAKRMAAAERVSFSVLASSMTRSVIHVGLDLAAEFFYAGIVDACFNHFYVCDYFCACFYGGYACFNGVVADY